MNDIIKIDNVKLRIIICLPFFSLQAFIKNTVLNPAPKRIKKK